MNLQKFIDSLDSDTRSRVKEAILGLSKYANSKLKQDLVVGYNFLLLKEHLKDQQYKKFEDYCENSFGISKKELKSMMKFSDPFYETGIETSILLKYFNNEHLVLFKTKGIDVIKTSKLIEKFIAKRGTYAVNYLESEIKSFKLKPKARNITICAIDSYINRIKSIDHSVLSDVDIQTLKSVLTNKLNELP